MQNTQIDTASVVLVIFLIVGLLMLAAMLLFFVMLFRIVIKRRAYDPRRGSEMAEAANKIGFTFKPQTEISDVSVLSNFELFEGNLIKLENLMSGKIKGREAALFDCVYLNVASPGSGATTSRQTMALIKDDRLNLPLFYLRPEGKLEKALNFLSRVDIDIEQHPNFSAKFLLYGNVENPDETAIRQTFNRRQLLDYLEGNEAFCALAHGKFLIVYQSRRLVPPNQASNWLAFVSDLGSLFLN